MDENRVDVDMFLSDRDRKLKFPGCAMRKLQYVMLCRALLGRKLIRDVHVNSTDLSDIAMFFAGVGVFDDHFPILTCAIDIVYIFCLQVGFWNYESFVATDLICLSVELSLWNNPFQERWMKDLRTNPFEEEGYDTILVRLASDVADSIQDPGVQRMIICDWVGFYSRTYKIELNSYGQRGEDHSCDLGLLDTTYVVRPNQCKSSVRDVFLVVEGSAFIQRCGCPRKFKRLCFIVGRLKVTLPEATNQIWDETVELGRQAPRRSNPSHFKRLGARTRADFLDASA